MRAGHIVLRKPPADQAAEAARAAAFERKQKWKEQPGHRYTAEELRQMSDALADFTIRRIRKRRIMYLP